MCVHRSLLDEDRGGFRHPRLLGRLVQGGSLEFALAAGNEGVQIDARIGQCGYEFCLSNASAPHVFPYDSQPEVLFALTGHAC